MPRIVITSKEEPVTGFFLLTKCNNRLFGVAYNADESTLKISVGLRRDGAGTRRGHWTWTYNLRSPDWRWFDTRNWPEDGIRGFLLRLSENFKFSV